tara:strand:+ start:1576 stop:1722 length:147 start_codon:yes stop_codon:yes gene_type:complete
MFQDCVELEQHNVTALKTTTLTVDAPITLELGHFTPLYDADVTFPALI